MNYLHGTPCHPVICQRKGSLYRWQDEKKAWHVCDKLPAHVYLSQPKDERARIVKHAGRDAK